MSCFDEILQALKGPYFSPPPHLAHFSDDDERPLPTRCESCSAVYYCGEACRNADAALHGTHCAQLKKASRDKAIKREEVRTMRSTTPFSREGEK